MTVNLSTAPLAGAARDALSVVSPSDVNRTLEGVWVDVHPYGISFTGTDRTLLCRADVECPIETSARASGMLTSEQALTLARMLEQHEQCRIRVDGQNISVRAGSAHWRAELADGSFPRWQALLAMPASGVAHARMSGRAATCLAGSRGSHDWDLTFPDHGYPIVARSCEEQAGLVSRRVYVLAQPSEPDGAESA